MEGANNRAVDETHRLAALARVHLDQAIDGISTEADLRISIGLPCGKPAMRTWEKVRKYLIETEKYAERVKVKVKVAIKKNKPRTSYKKRNHAELEQDGDEGENGPGGGSMLLQETKVQETNCLRKLSTPLAIEGSCADAAMEENREDIRGPVSVLELDPTTQILLCLDRAGRILNLES